MKKSIKKSLCLFLAISMMAAALSGCGKNEKTESQSTTSKKEIDVSKVETFTLLSDLADFNWDNPVAEEITKKTGVKIKHDLIIGDPNEKISLMTSSGVYNDIILNAGRSMQMMTKAKGYLKLDDLIDEYGPNIKKFYGSEYSKLKYSKQDPHIYAFGTGASYVADLTPGYYWNVGFFLQNQALKQLGYPEIKTPEDFEKALETFLKENPTMPDGSKREGLSLVTSDGFRFQFSITQPILLMNGLPLDGDWIYDKNTDNIAYMMTNEKIKEGFQWYNKLYNKGLIDPESFTQNYDTYLSKISSGKCVGAIDGYWQFSSANQQLKDSNPEAGYMLFLPLTDPETMTWSEMQPGKIAQAAGFSITTSCKNPEKVVNFFDFLASEEGQILTECGVEGVNYTIDDSGMRIQNPQDKKDLAKDGAEYNKRTGVQLYARGYNPWLHQPYDYKTSNGQQLLFSDDSSATDAFTDTEKQTLKKYGFNTFVDIVPQPSEFTPRPYAALDSVPLGFTDETKVASQKVEEIRLTYIAKAIMCKPEEFDGVWKEYMTALDEAGLDVLTKEMNQSYQERKELWGIK